MVCLGEMRSLLFYVMHQLQITSHVQKFRISIDQEKSRNSMKIKAWKSTMFKKLSIQQQLCLKSAMIFFLKSCEALFERGQEECCEQVTCRVTRDQWQENSEGGGAESRDGEATRFWSTLSHSVTVFTVLLSFSFTPMQPISSSLLSSPSPYLPHPSSPRLA